MLEMDSNFPVEQQKVPGWRRYRWCCFRHHDAARAAQSLNAWS
jgi:hypothetical protein